MYMLLRSNANVKESKYLDHLNSNLTNVTEDKVNKIRKQLIEIGKTLSNRQIKTYSKDLQDIINFISIPHEQRGNAFSKLSDSVKSLLKNTIPNKKIKEADINKINECLHSISDDIQYKRKAQYTAHDDDDYYGLKDLEYMYGDLDDYYKPILVGQSFNGNHEWCVCRGTKERDEYLDTLLIMLLLILDN